MVECMTFFQLLLKFEMKVLKLFWKVGFDVICTLITLSCQTTSFYRR